MPVKPRTYSAFKIKIPQRANNTLTTNRTSTIVVFDIKIFDIKIDGPADQESMLACYPKYPMDPYAGKAPDTFGLHRQQINI
jgi:hypothetical protein